MKAIETTNQDVELHERGLSITTSDHVHLGARIFEPKGDVRASVLMLGAVAVPQQFYARFARSLAHDGYRVLTFDYRGVGESRPESLRGYRATLSDWAERDYPAALDWLAMSHPERPLMAVGHSLGGQIVGLAPRAQELRAVATVASQSGYYGNFENSGRMALNWRVLIPSVAATLGFVPGWMGVGTDLPRGVALEWAKWCLSPEYYLGSHPDYRGPISQFEKPLLALTFTDDDYAPLSNVLWLHDRYAAAKLEHRHLDPSDVGVEHVGHLGFFRPHLSHLWSQVSAFFSDVLSDAIQTPRARSCSRAWVTDAEVRAELEHGRA